MQIKLLVIFLFLTLFSGISAYADQPYFLKDSIITLQITAGFAPAGIGSIIDVNGDGEIGLAEAIYMLRWTASGNVTYGPVHSGQYHLGPVDFAETQWHNACAPAGGYRPGLRECTGIGGEYLAGVSTVYNEGGGVCDRCILIKTALEREVIARIVTYGTTNEPGDIDVSPSVYAAINEGEYPRSVTWQFVKCPETSSIQYEFQTGAHIWWSSLWVRNSRIPIEKVEVQSSNHATFYKLTGGPDGTLTDSGGFGAGPFVLRITAVDGQVVEDMFESFPTGELVESTNQFE